MNDTSAPAPRLAGIDLARGIALLGVALVNVHAFAAIWGTTYGLDLARTAWDTAAEYAVAVLFVHRSYPVLAFLFGAGIGLQWTRQPEAAARPAALRARLWALMIIGIAHGLLLWPGEVLTTYSVAGLVMTLFFLRCEARRALVWGVGLLVLSQGLSALDVTFSLNQASAPWPIDGAGGSFAALSWASAQRLRYGELLSYGLMQLSVIDLWAFVLLGVWAGRSGALARFIRDPLEHRRLAGYGVLCLGLATALELYASTIGGWSGRSIELRSQQLMSLALEPACLGALWFWLTVGGCWAARQGGALRSLVLAVGRAPLTQFIGQSIIFALVFNRSFIGWHGELGRAAYSLVAVLTWLLLAAFTRAWLAGHRFGPMEMLWRRLTRALSSPSSEASLLERSQP